MFLPKFIAVAGIIALSVSVFCAKVTLSKETPTVDSSVVVLTASNTLNLNAEVDGDSVGAILSAAKALKPKTPKEPIYLFLNTPGGSIQAGLELIEAFHGMDRPVNTVTMFAASMGFQIAQNLGDRLILRNGVLMSHRAKGGFQGEFGGQDPSQVESRYNFWKTRIQELDEQTVARTGGKQTLQSYQAQYAPELWLTGTQSVDRGYADRIVTVKCDKSLEGFTTQTFEFMGVPVSFDLDKCPLNTAPQNIKIGGGQDGPLLPQRINEIKRAFINSYLGKQHRVVPMTW